MFWFAICVVAVLFGFLFEWFNHARSWRGFGYFIAMTVGGVILLICIIGSGTNYSKNYDLRKQEAILPVKEQQKEDLVALVEDQLSSEQFAALMSATETEAINIVFNNTTAVSNVLIARATEIIQLNKDINNIKNDILYTRINICNEIDNMFYPRVPFISGTCDFDFSSTN